ncbi:MAG: hypothetical protein RLZZ507_3726 [Cyanobacteriota bacterium]|jgi:hypothetical protein
MLIMRILPVVICACVLAACSTKSNEVASTISPTPQTPIPNITTSAATPDLSTTTSSTSSTRTKVASDPTSRNLADIASNWLNQPVDIEQEVENSFKYRNSNDFDRPKIKEQLTQAVQTRIASMQDIGVIEFNISLGATNYDVDNQVFYLEPFSPGRYFKMENVYGDTSAPPSMVAFTNSEQFYRLSIPADRAKEMIQFDNKPSQARVTARIDKVTPLSPGFKFETSLTRVLIYDKKGSILVDKTL